MARCDPCGIDFGVDTLDDECSECGRPLTVLVLVCGSRSFANRRLIRRRLRRLPGNTTILHGGARGADEIAGEVAEELGLSVEVEEANWRIDGRRAGVIRNLRMLDRRPTGVIAFWDGESRGTRHCFEEARRRHIPTEVIRAGRP